jgi:hypothetical protein
MPNEFLPSLLNQLSGNRLGSLLERLQRDALENNGTNEIGDRHRGDHGRRGDLPDDAVQANTRNESAYYGNDGDDGARLNQRNGDPGTTAAQGNSGDGTLDLPLSQLESLARNFSAMAKAADQAAAQLAQRAGFAESTPRADQLQAGEALRTADPGALRPGIANAASPAQATPATAAAGAATAPPGSAQVIAPQNAAQLASLERNLQPVQIQALQASRPGDAAPAALTQRADAVQVPLADRLSATQLQLPGQAVPMVAGRVDVVPLPLTPQIAGATMLVNNQVSNLSGTLGTSAREGIASQLRDASLGIPAGHTAEGRLRQRQPRRSTGRKAWLEALLPGRRRAATRDGMSEGTTGTPAFQWLFWLLAIVAYAAIAMAIVTLVPSGGDFVDVTGRPSVGGMALVAGIGLAVAAWAVARRLVRK